MTRISLATRKPDRISRITRALLVAVVAATCGVVGIPSVTPVGAVASTVTGTVYRDYNSNAELDTTVAQGLAVDTGVAGVIVKAYDAYGKKVGETTTSANGSYTLTITAASSSALRVEFSWANSGATAGLQPSFNGSDSATTVQFVEVGDTDVDLGVTLPGEYCQDNPTLVTCYAGMGSGSSNSKTGAQVFSSAMPTIRQSDYTSTSPSWNVNTGIANSDELGSVFGVGVDRTRNAYFGTYVRRHIDYGDAGAVNAIYRVNVDNPNVVTTFVTLPGTLPTHSSSGISSCCTGIDYTDDKGVFDDVGRVGLGDVDVTPDGRTLLAVDMNENAPKLYSIPINGTGDSVTAGTPTSVNITAPTTFNGVSCVGKWHPMGLGVRGTRVLVGGVCGAETTVSITSQRGSATTQAAAFVLELNGSTFTPILAFSLGYDRTCAETSDTAGEPCLSSTSTTATLLGGDWGAWNEYPTLVDWWQGGQLHSANPQPMLANIEIADNGDLILGLRDRFTDQQKYDSAAYTYEFDDATSGNVKYWDRQANAGAGALVNFTYGNKASYPMGVGDILRVCNNAGTLALESNGTCAGGAVGAGNSNANSVKEFYFDDLSRGWHSETTTGSLATMAGYSGVWSTAFDVNNWNQQGVVSLGRCTAAKTPANCYPTAGLNASNVGSKIGGHIFDDVAGFAKGNALSDIEVICDQAPVQIGNRVWIDGDRDGVQDPGEDPVSGVTVRLYAVDGTTLLGTAVTDANGEFYFDSTVSEAAAGNGDKVGGGLTADTAFVIRLNKASDYQVGGPLYEYTLTTATALAANTTLDTSIDSNASTVSSYPQIAVSSVAPGANNHTYDVGFYKSTEAKAVSAVGLGSAVWIDANGDGIKNLSEKPLAGAVVTLYHPDGTPATTIAGTPATATTDANGRYFIDNLAPGSYYARFSLPSVYKFTKKSASGSTSTNDSNADPSSGNTSVFTIGSSATGDTSVEANAATTAELINRTIGAGVVPRGTVSVGNYVWRDRNGDGFQSRIDHGVKGATLRLFKIDGSEAVDAYGRAVRAQTTASNGKYLFKNLLPGQYTVRITYPVGWEPTTADRPDRARNSSLRSATSVVLTAGQSDLTLDFGMVYRGIPYKASFVPFSR